MAKQHCEKCGAVLICPRCEGARGGQKTANTHSKKQLSEWGKQGGRGNKKPKP